jgi:hypothetical protein
VAVLAVAAVTLVVLRLTSRPAAAHRACRPPSAIGRSVTGTSASACDTRTGTSTRVPLAGLPAGGRVALQADGSIFVLVAQNLFWRPISGLHSTWHGLGKVPAGRRQQLCLSQPSVIVAVQVPAGKHGVTAFSWTRLRVRARSPVRLGPPARVTGNPCTAGLSQ